MSMWQDQTMDSHLLEDFEVARRKWFEFVVGRVVSTNITEVFADNKMNPTPCEQALLATHVGLGHIYGFSSADIAVFSYLSTNETDRLISHIWRTGRFDLRLARYLSDLWRCLYRLGRDTGSVRPEMLSEIYTSQVGLREGACQDQDMNPTVRQKLVSAFLANNALSDIAPDATKHYELDCTGSHLSMVRGLVERDFRSALTHLTMLEVIASFSDEDLSLNGDGDLLAASRVVDLSLSLPGGWPGPTPKDVPDWVATAVTTNGARLYFANAGFVPGWLFVAESQDQYRAIKAWTYNPIFTVHRVGGSGDILLGIEMTLPSDDSRVEADWRYQLNRPSNMRELRALLAIGFIRIDIYQIDSHSILEYSHSFGCKIPPKTLQCISELLPKELSMDEIAEYFQKPTVGQQLYAMAQIEQHAFDNLNQGFRAEPGSQLSKMFNEYLQAVDWKNATLLNGIQPDETMLMEAHETLRQEFVAAGRKKFEAIDPVLLGPERAYIQIVPTRDIPVVLTATACFIDEAGEPYVDFFEFDGPFDLSWSIDDQSAALQLGFSALATLMEKQISKLVVNAHSTAYNLPYHEAFLRMGFTEVSYTHRAATLTERERQSKPGAVVCGYAGQGNNLIQAVNTELEMVSALSRTSRSDQPPHDLPSVVHFAGHGHCGSKTYEIAMEIQDGESPMSSARVLLDFDASGTDLVYLSACSSGSGSYGELQLMDSVPMDVAFIEKGARTVLSTSAPVNDPVACYFATVFHHAYASGSSVWDSYVLARESTKLKELPENSTLLSKALERSWPKWKEDLERGSSYYPHDWQYFRLSGRHWD